MRYEAPKLIAMSEASDVVGACHNCEFGSHANFIGYHCAIGDHAESGYCGFGCHATIQISSNGIGPITGIVKK